MEPLISVKDIHKSFPEPFGPFAALAHAIGAGPARQIAHAVNGISFDIHKGETFAIVGESGSGKSTVGRMICGMNPPTKGDVYLQQKNLKDLDQAERRQMQLSVQMIFQNPFASLNPRMRVRDILTEAPKAHKLVPSNELNDFLDALMGQVGLDPADKNRFPHQFSGGQRQRIGIARALAINPQVLVCDEAVAALDVSIQAQILNLLMELQDKHNLTYLFISHDLGVVRHISNRIAVMYAGRIVETGDVEDIFNNPQHPYTQELINNSPRFHGSASNEMSLSGEPPSPFAKISGCAFHTRCRVAEDICRTETPLLRRSGETTSVACHVATSTQREAL